MHAVLAFSALPLLIGALLADLAYARTHEVQWTNFAAWLVLGAIVPAVLALLWAMVDRVRLRAARSRLGAWYLVVLLSMVVLGVVNALVHAMDAWGAMPAGPVLSAVVLLLGAAASVIGLAGMRRVVA